MAERRMFSQSVIDTDRFMDMPPTSQLLYLYLGMRADDEGFVSSPRSIMRLCSANNDDLKLLAQKGYIIPFDSGVIAVAHWQIHNRIRADRFKKTIHQAEREQLYIGKDLVYHLLSDKPQLEDTSEDGVPTEYRLSTDCQLSDNISTTDRKPSDDISTSDRRPTDDRLSADCQPTDNQLPPQDRIGKDRIGKDRLGKDRVGVGKGKYSPSPPPDNKPTLKCYGEYRHIRLSEEQYNKLITEYGEQTTAEYIRRCDEYIQQTGKSYKDHNLTLRSWIKKDGVKVSAKADYSAPGFWEQG